MSKIRLNRKTTILNDNVDNNVDVKLKFVYDVDRDRTWVYKEKFPEFELEYQNSQDESESSSNVEFGLHITMKDIEIDRIIIKKSWIPLTTVYGGINGVKLFIKHKIIETVFRWESSLYEILSISLNRLYINTQKQHETHFKNIKMYGTLFNYCGFGLDAKVK